MDPCPFVRLIVDSLALELSSATKPAGSGDHPTTTPCYAKLKIKNFPSQTALLPLCAAGDPQRFSTSSAAFYLDPDALRLVSPKPVNVITIKISVFTGRMGCTCGVTSGKLLGSVLVCVNLGCTCGVTSGKLLGSDFQLTLPSDLNTNNRVWTRTFSGDKNRVGRERKGWMIIVYDLSGSAVAAASMVTPFVPSSPGSDLVSRSNPGAWLILNPNGVSISSWKPWGRLEAWRERGPVDSLGYKFELITDAGLTSGVPIAEGTMSVRKGGEFCIDNSRKDSALSFLLPNRGFVMGSSVEGEGKTSKPVVQVGVQHVTCMADAALFVVLSAAIDLSMDACRLFSHKLRKEFSYDEQESFQ